MLTNYMKKMLTIILLLIFTLVLTSCNRQAFDFSLKYTKIHMSFDGQNYKCYNISSWRDYDDGEQIQVNIEGYGTILTSSYNAILIVDKCPFCDDEEE